MKKKQLLFLFLAIAMSLSTYANSGIYLMGTFNGWAASPEWEFVDEGNGIYTLSDKEIYQEFKVADATWSDCNLGTVEGGVIAKLGEPLSLSNNGANAVCTTIYKCSKITLTMPAEGSPAILLEGEEQPSSGIYIRGGMTNWEALPEWEFTNQGGGLYTMTNKTITGSFKIADSSWSTINYGINSSETFDINKTIILALGGNNISLDNAFMCSKISFSIREDGLVTLYVEGEMQSAEKPTAMYVIGNNNNWDFTDDSGKLLPTENEDEYKGEVTFNTVSPTTLAYWRIYEGLGSVGSWGNPGGANMTEHTESGTLERNSEGCITTNPGKYTVTFNLGSGQYKTELVEGVGISADEADECAFSLVDGILTLSNNNLADIYLYSQNGVLLVQYKSVNKADLSTINQGIYIIKIKAANKEKSYKLKL